MSEKRKVVIGSNSGDRRTKNESGGCAANGVSFVGTAKSFCCCESGRGERERSESALWKLASESSFAKTADYSVVAQQLDGWI